VHDHVLRGRTCATCRIALFHVRCEGPSRGTSHSHTAHELLTVTGGDFRIGRDHARPGTTGAIPARHRYHLRSGGGYELVNFRLDASYYLGAPGSEPVLDSVVMGAAPG